MTTTKKTDNAGSSYGTSSLAKALAAFQADLPVVTLDGDNPHFKSKFATLANVTRIVLPKLSEHGLAFSAGSRVEEGLLILEAKLLHESGEYESASFPITETNPQKVGSAVTYYRRYALAALTGVVADADDDGNAASTPSAAERQITKAASRPAARPANDAPAQAEVREWIGGDADKKATANAAYERIKKEQGLTGTALWEAVKTEVVK
jgi:hypothetical protein